MKSILVIVAAIAPMLLLSASTRAEPARPNVIVMMADDLGYDDLSCYDSKRIKSPVLDKMASEGIRLTSFYAGASVCSPSRMALMSGSYPTRVGWQGGVLGYGMKKHTGLSTDVVTIAEAFKAGGYRTAISGKWHIGDRDLRPHRQGFDETYYLLASNNIGRDVYRGDEVVHKKFDNRRLTETFTEEVVRVINAESDKPFFIYVPFTAPHFPAEAHPKWKGTSDDKHAAYVEVVEELDYRVGQILDAVKKKGIDDETIIVFMSDNGAQAGQRSNRGAGPFSGMKWSSREGGTRVPCIVRYPGVIGPGRSSDKIVAAIDLYPTLSHACGIELPANAQKLDGVSVWNTLIGKDTDHARTELLYWHGFGEATAIRVGNYKLLFGSGKKHGIDPDIEEGPALFHLANDPGESRDISAQHPQKVNELLELAKQRLAEIHTNRVTIGAWKNAKLSDEDAQPVMKWGKWLK